MFINIEENAGSFPFAVYDPDLVAAAARHTARPQALFSKRSPVSGNADGAQDFPFVHDVIRPFKDGDSAFGEPAPVKGERIAPPSRNGINPNMTTGGLVVIAAFTASNSMSVLVRIGRGKPVLARVRADTGRRRHDNGNQRGEDDGCQGKDNSGRCGGW